MEFNIFQPLCHFSGLAYAYQDDHTRMEVAVEQEPQRIAIAMARVGQRNPEGAKAFFKLIDNFCKEAEHEQK